MNRLFIIAVLAAMSGLAHAEGASLHARTAGEAPTNETPSWYA